MTHAQTECIIINNGIIVILTGFFFTSSSYTTAVTIIIMTKTTLLDPIETWYTFTVNVIDRCYPSIKTE